MKRLIFTILFLAFALSAQAGVIGKVLIGDSETVVFTVQTSRFSTGEKFDATGMPAYRIYEGENGTPILTGSMSLLDDAGTVGYYSEEIITSAGNGFEDGKSYDIRVTATIDGVAAAFPMSFTATTKLVSGLNDFDSSSDTVILDATQANYAPAKAGDSMDISSISGDSGAADNLELDYDGTGFTRANSTIGTVTTNSSERGNDSAAEPGDLMGLSNDAITNAKYDESTAFPVASVDGGATQIARVGADGDTLETLSDQLDAVETDTGDIQSKIGTPVALDGGAATVGGMLTKMADDNGGADFDAGTDSLQEIRDRGDAAWTTGGGGTLTSETIAVAVWNKEISDHTAVGSFGAKNQKVVPSETVGDYKADISALALEATVAALNNITAADVVTALFASTPFADGSTTYLEKEKAVLTMARGNWTINQTAGTIVFLASDNTTELYTLTLSSTARTRTP